MEFSLFLVDYFSLLIYNNLEDINLRSFMYERN